MASSSLLLSGSTSLIAMIACISPIIRSQPLAVCARGEGVSWQTEHLLRNSSRPCPTCPQGMGSERNGSNVLVLFYPVYHVPLLLFPFAHPMANKTNENILAARFLVRGSLPPIQEKQERCSGRSARDRHRRAERPNDATHG